MPLPRCRSYLCLGLRFLKGACKDSSTSVALTQYRLQFIYWGNSKGKYFSWWNVTKRSYPTIIHPSINQSLEPVSIALLVLLPVTHGFPIFSWLLWHHPSFICSLCSLFSTFCLQQNNITPCYWTGFLHVCVCLCVACVSKCSCIHMPTGRQWFGCVCLYLFTHCCMLLVACVNDFVYVCVCVGLVDWAC